jgi:hypothetical protein
MIPDWKEVAQPIGSDRQPGQQGRVFHPVVDIGIEAAVRQQHESGMRHVVAPPFQYISTGAEKEQGHYIKGGDEDHQERKIAMPGPYPVEQIPHGQILPFESRGRLPTLAVARL